MKLDHHEITAVVDARLGIAELPVSEIMNLMEGSIIEFNRLAGEPLEVYANGKPIAWGEAVVIDENFGIRITKIRE